MSFKVGDITAEPGTKAYGFLKVGTTSVNTYRIPVAIVNGAKPGKAVCVLGGTHGTEHAGIESVIRTVNDLNPKEMTGTLVAITVVNGPQFEHNSAFLSPFDSQNQNRVFPGDPEGTLSHRTAYVVHSKVVSKCDALVDTHGGDVNEDITGFVIATDGEDPAVNKMSLDMAWVILLGSSLSFVGLGVQPPKPGLGTMVAGGSDYLPEQWWISVFPALAIVVVVLGFNLLGDGLRDMFAAEEV